ncbi:MAG: VIT and VWA domain-containing protein [Anaerolineales bacterium]|nr:VIT and VWA domain-containing protein [Anaerolineales bacterium]MDW8160448.1 VIT and VWA domain-containing protein [Anaerolineales bacterium]
MQPTPTGNKMKLLFFFLVGSFWAILPVQLDNIGERIAILDSSPCALSLCADPLCPPLCPPTLTVQPVLLKHHVEVWIEDQVAITRVDQIFYNPNDWVIEGTHVFSIPHEAALTSFKLWVDDRAIEGEVLEATKARQKYERAASGLHESALLEYLGSSAVRARVFPIPPHGEEQITLEYAQVLPLEGGLLRYSYRLNAEKFPMAPFESFRIDIKLRFSTPILTIYSPSHAISVAHKSETEAQVSYTGNSFLPTRDFSLVISLGETQALYLSTFRDSRHLSGEDGVFLLLLSPPPQIFAQPTPRDVLLVLDRSSSMGGEKFQQSLRIVKSILDRLREEDRFNILAFNDDVLLYSSGPRPASEVPEAERWLESLAAEGSTNLHAALLQAIQRVAHDRPTYLFLFTDGLPTVGVRDSTAILEAVRRLAPENLRIFPFGVGYEVSTFLLDSLAQENRGQSVYVQPSEELSRKASTFYTYLDAPVITELALDFGEIEVYDIYPPVLSDLFVGAQLCVLGRYKGGGVTEIRLSGQINAKAKNFVYPAQKFDQEGTGQLSPFRAVLPRLWATRKIDHLLTQIQLRGADPELIGRIVNISIRYGVIAPYTSFFLSSSGDSP